MKKFTFAEDVRLINPNIEFKEMDVESEFSRQHKFYKEGKLINNNFIDFIITNRSFHYTDFLYNKYGLTIVSTKLLNLISDHITCRFDSYLVRLYDENNNIIVNAPQYFLIHIREHKPIIDINNSLISRTSERIPEGFLIKPKFNVQASDECFVRDNTYPYAIYVNAKFIEECKKLNITGFEVL